MACLQQYSCSFLLTLSKFQNELKHIKIVLLDCHISFIDGLLLLVFHFCLRPRRLECDYSLFSLGNSVVCFKLETLKIRNLSGDAGKVLGYLLICSTICLFVCLTINDLCVKLGLG